MKRSMSAALLALVLTVVVSATAQASSDGLRYVALGDSYSSGVGAPPYDPASGDCRRSDNAYPSLLAAGLSVDAFAFVACSGAGTADIKGGQLSALDVDTDLVTVTAGGNDAGFTPVLTTCVLLNDRKCAAALDGSQALVRALGTIVLSDLYAQIRSRAPHARVVVVGYPLLFDSAAAPVGRFNAAEQQRFNDGTRQLNGVARAAAAAAGFDYVDAEAAFAGRGIGSADPWLLPFTDPLNNSFHPTSTGHAEGYLPAVAAVVATG